VLIPLWFDEARLFRRTFMACAWFRGDILGFCVWRRLTFCIPCIFRIQVPLYLALYKMPFLFYFLRAKPFPLCSCSLRALHFFSIGLLPF
jgi:hypothetical protein